MYGGRIQLGQQLLSITRVTTYIRISRIRIFRALAQLPQLASHTITHAAHQQGNICVRDLRVPSPECAEMLLRRLGTLAPGTPRLGPGNQSRGVAAMTADLQQLGFTEAQFRITDGSGVAHEGQRGDAARRAKTGTMSAVSNLAGDIETRSGRRLAFAILCQNFVGSPKPWRDL